MPCLRLLNWPLALWVWEAMVITIVAIGIRKLSLQTCCQGIIFSDLHDLKSGEKAGHLFLSDPCTISLIPLSPSPNKTILFTVFFPDSLFAMQIIYAVVLICVARICFTSGLIKQRAQSLFNQEHLSALVSRQLIVSVQEKHTTCKMPFPSLPLRQPLKLRSWTVLWETLRDLLRLCDYVSKEHPVCILLYSVSKRHTS